MRILLIPIFTVVGWDRRRLVASALLLGFIGATDWIDGYLARRLNQTSTFGKVLDPSADRALLLCAGILSVHLNLVPIWLLAVIFLRELSVTVVVATAAIKYRTRFDVVWYGKAGTLLMMFAFPMFVMAGARIHNAMLFKYLAYVFIVPGQIVLFAALASYLRKLTGLVHRRRLS